LPTFVCVHRNSKLSASIFAQYSHVNSYLRASEPRTFKIDGIIPMRRSGSRSLGSGFLEHQANSVDKADDALNSKMQRTTGRKGTAMPTVRSLNGGSIVCDNPRKLPTSNIFLRGAHTFLLGGSTARLHQWKELDSAGRQLLGRAHLLFISGFSSRRWAALALIFSTNLDTDFDASPALSS
jgi:hypothetical protein